MRQAVYCAVVAFLMIDETFCGGTCKNCDCSTMLYRNRISVVISSFPENWFPFLVLLHDYLGMCGGTLITPRHVMTSDTCANELDNRYTVAALGVHEIDKKRDIIRVHNFIVYTPDSAATLPSSPFTATFVALAVLEKNAVYNDKVKPACLLPYHFRFKPAVLVKVVGWGEQGYRGPPRKTPALGNLENRGICYETNICLIGKHYPCNGDQGGPIIVFENNKTYTTGVQVYNDAGANGLLEGLNLTLPMPAVAPALPWIKSQTGEHCICDVEP